MKTRKIILFTGPSGVGKATIEKELFKDKSLKLRLSVSATTRKPRQNEKDGIHYHFISKERFNELINENHFLEWNEHFSNKYGTLKSEIKRILDLDYSPIIEVEPVGAKKIIENYNNNEIISFFISPPSIDALKNRIKSRATETKQEINQRMKRVEKELSFIPIFQHIITNDNIKTTVEKIKKILKEKNNYGIYC